MPDRTVIIGDVHGCIHELDLLIEELQLSSADQVIFAGDLVNKGPASHEVLQRARELNAKAVIGNHEARLLRAYENKTFSKLRSRDLNTARQLTETDWQTLKAMSLFIELPEFQALVVHGGFIPGIPWREQGEEIVTRVQVLDNKLRACKRSEAPNGVPWADHWTGPEHVVYGHTPRREVLRRPYSIGIDTGCVYGGHLTAYILPEGKLHQIKATQIYEKSSEF
jgi:predicted phosphodiesterase